MCLFILNIREVSADYSCIFPSLYLFLKVPCYTEYIIILHTDTESSAVPWKYGNIKGSIRVKCGSMEIGARPDMAHLGQYIRFSYF